MPSDAQNMAGYQPLRAPRGTSLSCKGWQQEAVLRMLLNCLDPDVAEDPRELIMGGEAGKTAAKWEDLHATAAALRNLRNDEFLIVHSGKPSGVFPRKPNLPCVLSTGAPGGPTGEIIGDWLYVGTQTALPILYELYSAAASTHFSGTLAGKLVVGGGMGGAGGAQPLAAALNGAAFLGVDADAERIKRRVKTGYCEVMVNSLDEALRVLKNAVRRRKSASVGLIGNCAEIFPQLAERGVVPDLLTDYTPAHEPFAGYIPPGLDSLFAASAHRVDPDGFRDRARESAAIQQAGAQDLEKLGAHCVTPATAVEYLHPLATAGAQLTTWLALSGEPADIARIDRLALEMFPNDERLQRWLPMVSKYVRFQGLPARLAWLSAPQLGSFGRALNDLVERREVAAPAILGCRCPLFGRDQNPSRDFSRQVQVVQTNLESRATWLWIGGGGDPAKLRLLMTEALVADGTPEAAERLANWPTGQAAPPAL